MLLGMERRVCHGLRADSFPQQLFHHFNELEFHSPQRRFPAIPPLSQGLSYRCDPFSGFSKVVLAESSRTSLLKHSAALHILSAFLSAFSAVNQKFSVAGGFLQGQ